MIPVRPLLDHVLTELGDKWTGLHIGDFTLVPEHELTDENDEIVLHEDGTPIVIPAQQVAHLAGQRLRDGTYFYQTLSVLPDADFEWVRIQLELAIDRFREWSACDCKLDYTCAQHGGIKEEPTCPVSP